MSRPSLGTGTKEDPFLITTAEEMAYMIRTYDCEEGVCYRKFYKLTCDLDMKSTQWTFGSATSDRKCFRAHFDGAGHKICNIEVTLKDSPEECHYGLFPQLGGDSEFESVIENLELQNIHFVRSTGDATGTFNFRIGGLVGKMYSHSKVSNCIVSGFAVTDYGTDINMYTTSKISACPLVGEILDDFGNTKNFYEAYGISIIHSYGRGTSDLSRFHGRSDQIFTADVQGIKQKNGFIINGYPWYNINENDCSFSMMTVNVANVAGEKFKYEGNFPIRRGHTYAYHWSLDGIRIGNNRTAVVTVEPKPYIQRLKLTVFDNGQEAGNGAFLIEPDVYHLNIEEDPKHKKIISGRIYSESGASVNPEDFDFEWTDMSDNDRVVGHTQTLERYQPNHTYMLLATHKKNRAAKFSIIKSFCRPIYVCNRGITGADASIYTSNGKVYNTGSDANNGLSPETAVRTLKRAYQLLTPKEKGGTIDNNVIVIMGDYGSHDYPEYYDNRCTRSNPQYFPKDRPALITGRYDNFKNGRLLFAGLSVKFDADTRFEQINLHGSSFELEEITDQVKVFACGHDLTFGNGIYVSGYKIMDYTLGLDEGVFAPTFTIYGGVLNNDNPNYIPKENTVTILSGNYGRVIAGDGYTLQMGNTLNVSGTPKHPIRTHVVCDASNYYNPYHTQYDVALIIGGQADGTIFADTRIDVKGNSRVGRIVGGNVGFGRLVKGRPADSFFGRSEVTVSGGTVTEIYGTNLGRYGHILYASETEHDSCVTYFYGESYLNLLGGTIESTVYGGGCANVTGFGYDPKHHTYDPYIPYWKNDKIVFGRYDDALGRMPIIQLRDSGKVDLSKTSLHVNIGGDAHLMGSVYGGSLSFSSLLPTHQAGCQSGCIFADTYVSMTGGLVDGYIFGGCRGNLSYFDNSDHSNYPLVNGIQMDKLFFANMAQMYGHAHVSITGGEVKGIVYGGGEGTYYRQTSSYDMTNAVGLLGSTYGTTEVTIGGDAILRSYIFGAGNYAHVLRTGHEDMPELAGCVEINIAGGKMYAAAFGAGHGNKDMGDDIRSIYTRVAGDVRVNVTGGQFLYSDMTSRYIKDRIYGVVCGGIATSIVRGDTYLNVEANPFPAELKSHPSVRKENLILCAGGYSKDCAIVGTAHLVVDAQGAEKIDNIYMGGVFGTVEKTEALILSGHVENIYGTGRHGGVNSNIVDINVGVEGETFRNESISIDNIYSGDDPQKTSIKIYGGYVMNVLRSTM